MIMLFNPRCCDTIDLLAKRICYRNRARTQAMPPGGAPACTKRSPAVMRLSGGRIAHLIYDLPALRLPSTPEIEDPDDLSLSGTCTGLVCCHS